MAAINFPNSPTNGQVYSISNGSAWKYNSTRGVWNSISGEIKRSIFQYTNIAGSTVITLNYVPNNLDVYYNGTKLINTVDYTATNGTSITLSEAVASASDYIEVITWGTFEVVDALTATDASATATASTLALRDASADLYANSFISSSDERVKKDFAPIENALDVITALQGLTFTYTQTGEKSAGFIAQEFEKVLPDLVHVDANGMRSINYLGVIAYLVEAIKELRG